MKTIYFVDSENTGEKWIDLFLEDEKAEFFVFYTDKSPRISYDKMSKLLSVEKKPTLIHVNTGKNALDFQLVSSLGYVLHAHPTCKFVILSNDSGFDPVVDFWKAKGKTIERQAFKENKPAKTNTTAQVQTVQVQTVTEDEDEHIVRTVLSCIQESAQAVHLSLVYFLGTKKAKKIYTKLKKQKNNLGNPEGSQKERLDRFVALLLTFARLDYPVDEFSSKLQKIVLSSQDRKEYVEKIQTEMSEYDIQKVSPVISPMYVIFNAILNS